MFEKVNPEHPDKIADRIAGAIVDMTYRYTPFYMQDRDENPRVAVEVLIGHGSCRIITETSVMLNEWSVKEAVRRISGLDMGAVDLLQVKQDKHLADNQAEGLRCGDNGIFVGIPVSEEEQKLTNISKLIYETAKETDGKYIADGDRLIICQSNCMSSMLRAMVSGYGYENVKVNPLGEWTGGISVDSGATNRKLGSDMGRAVSGGGLHGKDLSKADVSINIYAHLKAQETGQPVGLSCAIGDDMVDGKPYSEIVEIARNYIQSLGGFEKFAEWGLIRPEG